WSHRPILQGSSRDAKHDVTVALPESQLAAIIRLKCDVG
ncbi:MAG: hypothetical protein ACI9UA_005087, partial [Pseudoalteromonas tetraodonis]